MKSSCTIIETHFQLNVFMKIRYLPNLSKLRLIFSAKLAFRVADYYLYNNFLSIAGSRCDIISGSA
jgi:hypothetical protein